MSRYRFGPFELDTERGELRKHGVRIRIQKQPFQVLRTLLERAGTLVSREDLRQTLWADNTFVDFEHGINAAVNKVRQALGDVSGRALYVETVPGEGYRFVAPTEKQPGQTISSNPPSPDGGAPYPRPKWPCPEPGPHPRLNWRQPFERGAERQLPSGSRLRWRSSLGADICLAAARAG